MEDRFIENYRKGFPFLKLVAAATPERGISVMDEAAQREAVERYDAFRGKVVKFVPASGAASRMFKDLFEGRDAGQYRQVRFLLPGRFRRSFRLSGHRPCDRAGAVGLG